MLDLRAARVSVLFVVCLLLGVGPARGDERPNIIWLMAEDMGTDLACYGTAGLQTPNLDRLARQGARYTRAYCENPICSPNRSGMMVGVHPTVIDAQHHRSNADQPLIAPYRPITALLREAGYTCLLGHDLVMKRGEKTDCNFVHTKTGRWDNSEHFGLFDRTADFTAADQPFFSQIQLVAPHRGDWWLDVRAASDDPVDPAAVGLPPYLADTPETRFDWAVYLDQVEFMDAEVGRLLERLREQGLEDNTVVIFIADNGRCNIRGKGFLYDDGLRVPMIVRAPGLVEPGTVVDDLLQTTDISATVLRLAGAELPAYLTGRAFLGVDDAEPRAFVRSARDIWGEIDECSRSITTERFKYIRNYMPQVPWSVDHAYSELNRPALHVMRRLQRDGALTPAAAFYMRDRKPDEELYDLDADPFEIHSLAGDPAHHATLQRMRDHETSWLDQHHDHGLADLGHRVPTVGSTVGTRAAVKARAPELWERLESGELMPTHKWNKQFR